MIALFPTRTVAVDLFGFAIHWYGLLYLVAFLLAAWLLPRLQQYRNLRLTSEEWMSIISWAVLGVIVGGRLGYVLFFERSHFLRHPAEIIMVWKGGMSSHGGFIGVAIALSLACLLKRIDPWKLADVVVVPAAIGLALGRLGNFINQELYGTATTLPWGITVPGVEGFVHPTQLYGILKDLLIACACFLHLRYAKTIRPGRTFALFLMLYGILRFLLEFLRVQSYPLVVFGGIALSRGQLLTIPVFIAGLVVWFVFRRKAR
ncbi:MAG: prolipoprotein diacylglyceryl transferase [Candidatus Peregrinibacteria bacterium]|nr:prolipoprotein diacylglyceryl transferase [Candidatus Peregrinibacteria bacterium]